MAIKITKEIFDKCMYGRLPRELEREILPERDVYGYGIKSTQVYKEGEDYYVTYTTYDNCD